LNVCLTPAEYQRIKAIAAVEDRDIGYIAARLMNWAVDQYVRTSGSLVRLQYCKAVMDENFEARVRARLKLRQEVTGDDRAHAELPARKRA
jgi:hypothetical protein